LFLCVHDCEYTSVDVLTDWISTRFPKLKKLGLRLSFEIPDEEVNSDEIVEQVLRHHKKLQEIQGMFSYLDRFNLSLELGGLFFCTVR